MATTPTTSTPPTTPVTAPAPVEIFTGAPLGYVLGTGGVNYRALANVDYLVPWLGQMAALKLLLPAESARLSLFIHPHVVSILDPIVRRAIQQAVETITAAARRS